MAASLLLLVAPACGEVALRDRQDASLHRDSAPYSDPVKRLDSRSTDSAGQPDGATTDATHPPGADATTDSDNEPDAAGQDAALQPDAAAPDAGTAPDAGSPPRLREVHPVEIDDFLANPGIGWMTFRKAAIVSTTIPPGVTSTVHYRRIDWSAIHLGDGRYDWTAIESQIEQARQGGQQYLFRIMPTNPSASPPTSGPPWMKDAGYAGFTHKHQGQGDDLWVPDLDDPRVQTQVSKVLRALGERYDGHPDVLAFEISFFGTWGEGHFGQAYLTPVTDPPTRVPIPTDVTLQWLVNEHYRHFPHTPLIGPIGCIYGQTATQYAFEQQGAGAGIGIFFDAWGDYPSVPENWSHMTVEYPQCLRFIHSASDPAQQKAWQTGLLKLEANRPMRDWNPEDIRKGLAWALEKHASLMHQQNVPVPTEAVSDIIETLKRLGYRLVLRRLAHAESVKRGQTLSVQLDFENIGVAPAYKDYYLAIRLRHLSTGQTHRHISTQSIKHWLPARHARTLAVSMPGALEPGEYELAVGIVSPHDKKPAVKLAIAGIDQDGWYPSSTVKVTLD